MCSQLQKLLLAQSPPCKWPARNSSLFFAVEVTGAASRCIWRRTKVHRYLTGLSELLKCTAWGRGWNKKPLCARSQYLSKQERSFQLWKQRYCYISPKKHNRQTNCKWHFTVVTETMWVKWQRQCSWLRGDTLEDTEEEEAAGIQRSRKRPTWVCWGIFTKLGSRGPTLTNRFAGEVLGVE